MASPHPFQALFETFGRLPAAHAEAVNAKAHAALGEALSVPVGARGRCILLRAPRAGHGKTHLLSRLQHQLADTHEFIPLQAVSGSRIDARSATDDTLRRLGRQLPASAGLSVLDLLVRRLFAAALQPLVQSGEVPCQDREGALAALRNRPIETFDFDHPNAVTAHWARENFEVLGPRLSFELSQRADLSMREVTFWVEALFKFASTPAGNPERVRDLTDLVLAGKLEEGAAMERLAALLGLVALLVRVVLVADELEGFSADGAAALRFAAFVGALRQLVEPLDVIVSLNKDIWESAFLPRLSGGLADRLSEVVIELEPLTEEEIVALLNSRVPGLGAEVLDHVDLHKAETHPRGLLKAAAAAWLAALERRSGNPAPPGPAAPAEEAVARPEVGPQATPPVSPKDEPRRSASPPTPATPPTPGTPGTPGTPPKPAASAPAFPAGGAQWFSTAGAGEQSGASAERAEADDAGAGGAATSSGGAGPAGVAEPGQDFCAVEPPEGVPQKMADLPPMAPDMEPQPAAENDTPNDERGFADPIEPSSSEDGTPRATPDAAAVESDRVDDLLRQFRERYGRGGL